MDDEWLEPGSLTWRQRRGIAATAARGHADCPPQPLRGGGSDSTSRSERLLAATAADREAGVVLAAPRPVAGWADPRRGRGPDRREDSEGQGRMNGTDRLAALVRRRPGLDDDGRRHADRGQPSTCTPTNPRRSGLVVSAVCTASNEIAGVSNSHSAICSRGRVGVIIRNVGPVPAAPGTPRQGRHQ